MAFTKADRARLCLHLMMGFSLLGSAIAVGSIVYHGVLERTPTLVHDRPYMSLLSFEWCLTVAYGVVNLVCASMLSSGNTIAQRWAGEAAGSRPANGYAMPTRVAVSCAVLFSACLVYLLFCGTAILSEQIERGLGAGPPQPAASGDPAWHANLAKRARHGASGDVAAAAAPNAPTPSAAPLSTGEGHKDLSPPAAPPSVDGQCADRGVPGSGPNGELTVREMFWVTLESVVDAFAAMVDFGEPERDDYEDDGTGAGYASAARRYKVSPAQGPRTPIECLRRLDLVIFNVLGVALSLWGIICFDITVEESRRRRRRPDGRPTRAAVRDSNTQPQSRANARGFDETEEKSFAPERHDNPALTLDAVSTLSTSGKQSHRDEPASVAAENPSTGRKAKAAAYIAQEAAARAAETNPVAKKNQ